MEVGPLVLHLYIPFFLTTSTVLDLISCLEFTFLLQFSKVLRSLDVSS